MDSTTSLKLQFQRAWRRYIMTKRMLGKDAQERIKVKNNGSHYSACSFSAATMQTQSHVSNRS